MLVVKTVALQIRSALRRAPLAFCALAVIGLALFFNVRELQFAMNPDAPLFDVLGAHTRYWLIWPLAAAAIAHDVATAPRRVGMHDALEAHTETVYQHWLSVTVPALCVLGIVYAVHAISRTAIVAMRGYDSALLRHVLAQVTLDLLIPGLIGVLVGVGASRLKSRVAGYSVLAAFAIVIGPYAEFVPAVTAYSTGLDLYGAYDLLRVLPPDPVWFVDPLYGFPLEGERWLVAAFWLLCLSAVTWSALASPSWRLGRQIRVVLAVLSACTLVLVLLPSSELRRDMRLVESGTLSGDQAYYQLQAATPRTPAEAPEFRVGTYEMTLEARRELSAEVVMHLEDDTHEGEYEFTLYHGFAVIDVLGADGRSLEFKQDGDFVTVESPADQAHLTFIYRGSGGRFIANSQGVFLPGYFAYYPVPGRRNMWDHLYSQLSPSTTMGSESRYIVRFDGCSSIASNLPAVGDRFEGQSATATFIGGFVSQTEVDGHVVSYYPASGLDPGGVTETQARLAEIERELGIPESVLPHGVAVFQLPGLAQYNGFAVWSPDAVFVSGLNSGAAEDLVVASLPSRPEREALKQAFAALLRNSGGLGAEGAEHFAEGNGTASTLSTDLPSHDEILTLEEARMNAHTDVEFAQEYYVSARVVVARLLNERVQRQGPEAVLREVYTYLASDSQLSELEFLALESDGGPDDHRP
jgi:hypothetical protein